jgi:hypothetical protein
LFPLLRVVRSLVLHTFKSVNSLEGVIALFVFKLLGLVGVGVGLGVATGVGVGLGVATGVGVGLGVATGFDLVARAPFFQVSFLPLLMHVYFLPAKVDICPAFLQFPPILMAAVAFNGAIRAKTKVKESRILFMGRVSRFF